MTARRRWWFAARLALVLVLAGLTVPNATVRPATFSLTEVETAKDVDFSDGVVWILALGSDARPGQDVLEGNSDAIQLVGLDLASGRAAGIGIPRDSWLEIPGHGLDRINQAMSPGRSGPHGGGRRGPRWHPAELRVRGRVRRVQGDGRHHRRGRRAVGPRVPGRRVRPRRTERSQRLQRHRGPGLHAHQAAARQRLRPIRQPAGDDARDPRGSAGGRGRGGVHGARGAGGTVRPRHRPRADRALPPGPGGHPDPSGPRRDLRADRRHRDDLGWCAGGVPRRGAGTPDRSGRPRGPRFDDGC